jgi:hypothetical protein
LFRPIEVNPDDSSRVIETRTSQHPNLGVPTLGTILLIILVLLLLGALPSWPYSATWGPAPAGILGVVLVVVLILVLLGRV